MPSPEGATDPVHPPADEIGVRHLGRVRSFFARRPVASDILVVASFLIPAVISLPAADEGVGGTIVLVAVILMTAAALAVRRRHPLLSLAVALGLGTLELAILRDSPVGIEWAAMLALYAVASLRPPRVAWVAAIVAIVVTAAQVVFLWPTAMLEGGTAPVGGEGQPVSLMAARLIVIGTFAAINLAALAIGLSVYNRRQQTRAMVERVNRLALEREQRDELATATERARIAREMHDVVAHSLSVMVALADGAGATLAKKPDQSARALSELSQTGRDALSEMRRILGVLREHDGDDAAPLAPLPALDELLDSVRATGLPVRMTHSGPPLPQDPGLVLTVYRIVQESLTNVLRYAPASGRVTVAVAADPCADRPSVTVQVDNDAGPGPRPTVHGSGRGLIGMRERVAAYGGTVSAGPTSTGWRVLAELHPAEGAS